MSSRSAARAAKKAKQAGGPAPLVFDVPAIGADPANREDLNKLAEQIESGSASLAPATIPGNGAAASTPEVKPGPVLAESPKSRSWENNSELAYPARPIGAQDENKPDRRRDAVDLQLRAISARLPRLIEQAVNELEARSKAELDRRWAGSMKVFEERLAVLDRPLKESFPETAGAPQSSTLHNEAVKDAIQQLKAENKEHLASISFYKVAFCMLGGALVFGAILFFHFVAK
jgi:hypothetical protein